MILSGMFGAGGRDPTAALRAELFGAGEPGWIYNPNRLATLFQDSAMTIPVTAAGQPVGAVLDLSGNGNHATQPTATARPLLQQDAFGRYFIQSDGADDALVFPTLAASSGQGRLLAAKVQFANSIGSRIIIGSTVSGGWLGVQAPAGSNFIWAGDGTTSSVLGTILASVIGYYGGGTGGLMADGSETTFTAAPGARSYNSLFSRIGGTEVFTAADFYGGVLRIGETSQAQALLVDDWLSEAR